MLSRVAENLYWLARHIERAENTARVVNVNGLLQLDLPVKARTGWEPLISITGSAQLFRRLYKSPTEKNVIAFLVGDERNVGSIINSLRAARENARTMRDVMPREAWEEISGLYTMAVERLQKGRVPRDRDQYLRSIIRGAQTVTGLLSGTMSHDTGYSFLRMGRNLERTDMTSRIIDVRSADLLPEQGGGLRPFETIQWMSVLRSLSGYQMYRQHVDQSVRRIYVLEFLLKDEDFPRAIFHCLGEIESCLADLPHNRAALEVIRRLRKTVREADLDLLEQRKLATFIDRLQVMLGEIHDCIARTYFRPDIAA